VVSPPKTKNNHHELHLGGFGGGVSGGLGGCFCGGGGGFGGGVGGGLLGGGGLWGVVFGFGWGGVVCGGVGVVGWGWLGGGGFGVGPDVGFPILHFRRCSERSLTSYYGPLPFLFCPSPAQRVFLHIFSTPPGSFFLVRHA